MSDLRVRSVTNFRRERPYSVCAQRYKEIFVLGLLITVTVVASNTEERSEEVLQCVRTRETEHPVKWVVLLYLSLREGPEVVQNVHFFPYRSTDLFKITTDVSPVGFPNSLEMCF